MFVSYIHYSSEETAAVDQGQEVARDSGVRVHDAAVRLCPARKLQSLKTTPEGLTHRYNTAAHTRPN